MSCALSVVLDRPSLTLPYESIAASQGTLLSDEDEVHVSHDLDVGATIVVRVAKAVKVSLLKVRFASQQFLQDQEESQAGSVELFSQELILLQNSSGLPDVLPVGLHKYRATFQVPSWLPPTFTSTSNRVTHRIVAQMGCPSSGYMSFTFKKFAKTAVQDLILLREAPTTLNALRYWSGERRSAATSLAVKTTRFARINGRLKVSMRVKSFEQLNSCKVDIVQEEASSVDLADDSAWHALPGSTSAIGQMSQFLPFLGLQFVKGSAFTKRKFPMPTISTSFPAPETPASEVPENCATLSTLSLEFPVAGHELHPRYESPLLTISHKLRIRIRFCNPAVKEIVVNIPITLFEGSSSCDDIPPYYEEIYSEDAGRRSRTDSVATLPVYSPKEAYSPPLESDVSWMQTSLYTPAPSSCQGSPFDSSTSWLQHDDNMRAPSISV